MNRKKWEIIKSRRDALHNIARNKRRKGLLRFKRLNIPQYTAPTPEQIKAIPEKPKIDIVKPPTGFFRKVIRRITGG